MSTSKWPRPDVVLESSFTRAEAIISCLRSVGSLGTSFRSDLKHSCSDVPAVLPVKYKLGRIPTTSAILEESPHTTTMLSICGSVNTSLCQGGGANIQDISQMNMAPHLGQYEQTYHHLSHTVIDKERPFQVTHQKANGPVSLTNSTHDTMTESLTNNSRGPGTPNDVEFKVK